MSISEFGVLIMRAQPFHIGHLNLINYGLKNVVKLIIVLGSASSARTVKNPWTFDERIDMIRGSLDGEANSRIEIIPANDYLYNDNLWISNVQQRVDEITNGSDDVSLIGFMKDRSSFYLSLFPQWNFIGAGDSFIKNLDATKIRDLYFNCDLVGIQPLVTNHVFEKLRSDMMETAVTKRDSFVELKNEYEFMANYLEPYKHLKYPVTFNTVDAVAIQSGHILVIRRRCYPGKGLLALPGGHLSQNETREQCAIRELKEETGISLSKEDLKNFIVGEKDFDHPERSLRKRTITHVFCFDLGMGKLHRVKGQDDADKAFWMPFNDVLTNEHLFFEDHAHIIRHFIMK